MWLFGSPFIEFVSHMQVLEPSDSVKVLSRIRLCKILMDWPSCLQNEMYRVEILYAHFHIVFELSLNFSDFLVRICAHQRHENFRS